MLTLPLHPSSAAGASVRMISVTGGPAAWGKVCATAPSPLPLPPLLLHPSSSLPLPLSSSSCPGAPGLRRLLTLLTGNPYVQGALAPSPATAGCSWRRGRCARCSSSIHHLLHINISLFSLQAHFLSLLPASKLPCRCFCCWKRRMVTLFGSCWPWEPSGRARFLHAPPRTGHCLLWKSQSAASSLAVPEVETQHKRKQGYVSFRFKATS